MRWIALAVGMLCAVPAAAQWSPEHPYRGQWGVTKPNSPRYQAILLIDSAGRVTIDSQNESATLIGYVSAVEGDVVRMIVTDRKKQVARSHCTALSRELMTCYTVRDDKSVSSGVTLVKVGPGPHRLTPPAR